MIGLMDDVLRVSVILGVGLLAARLTRKQSAAIRHWILVSAVACALAIPAAERLAPAWRLPAFGLLAGTSPTVSVSETFSLRTSGAAEGAGTASGAAAHVSPRVPSVDTATLLGFLWLAGTFTSLCLLAVGLVRLRWLASGAQVVTKGIWRNAALEVARADGIARPVSLLQTEHPTLLVTWGFAHPKIILPASARDWSHERVRIVLRHELAHVRRGDWVAQLLGELLRAIYWFNPLVWIVCRKLRDESEHACDDAVLKGGIDGSEYAAELLELARTLSAPGGQWLPAPAMARPSSLEGRVRAMLHASLNRTPVDRPRKLMTLGASVALAIAVAGFQVSAQSFASLSGSVSDQLGGSVPHVKMVLSSQQSDQKYEVHTNEVGLYRFVGLPAGEYHLEAWAAGFKLATSDVVVSAPSAVRDVTLTVGSLEETISVVGGRSAEPERPRTPRAREAAAKPAACVSAAPGGSIKQPTKIADMRPRYPENLKATGEGGVVVLDATIGADGTVREMQPVDASVQPDLARAAMDAVRQWRYTPTLLNCVPIDVQMKVTVRFSIE